MKQTFNAHVQIPGIVEATRASRLEAGAGQNFLRQAEAQFGNNSPDTGNDCQSVSMLFCR